MRRAILAIHFKNERSFNLSPRGDIMQTKNRAKLIATVGILLGGLMMTGCGNKTAANAPPQAGPPEVGVVVVQPQRVQLTTELSGRTSPFQIAEVRPQV